MSKISLPPYWFKLNLYSRSDQLDFEGWKTQIGNRVFLAGLLVADQVTMFDEHFSSIMGSPFMDLGFDANYGNTASVYPLLYGKAATIISTLTPQRPAQFDSCDEKLAQDSQESFAMFRHLTIDLHASESEIIEHFKAYLSTALKENREQFKRHRGPGISLEVLKGWHEAQILPYYDLHLWHTREQLDIPSDTVLSNWLFPHGNGDKDKARATRKKAPLIFTAAMHRQLAIADFHS